MPVWLQIIAAVSSAVFSGVMGISLIPFLQKCRFCEPDPESPNAETASGSKLKPTMCGILLIFGCTAGLVLSYTLYMQFSGTDRTSTEFQSESRSLRLMLIQGLVFGFLGWLLDYQRVVRKEPDTKDTGILITLMTFFVNYSLLHFLPQENILNLGFMQWDAGALSYFIRSALLTLFWRSMQKPEQNSDGISITICGMQCLLLTVLCIVGNQFLNALYALTAAGACMGCFFWNLHPAKCRLGQTGTYWLGVTVPMICLNTHQLNIFVLFMAVWVVNDLPLLLRKRSLLDLLKLEGISPIQRIIILTGFALFCGILSVMPEHT